jgi:Tfp pilus assembly protein PilV
MTGKIAITGKSGLTLLEIIVALAIMIIGIASVFALFAAATAIHKRAVDQTNAAIIAQKVLSELDRRLTTGVDVTELQKTGAALPEFPNYTYDLRLAPLDKTQDEFYVDLIVCWKTKGRARELKFSTICIRSLPFKEREKNYPEDIKDKGKKR